MIISNKDIKTIYFCPRKAKFDIEFEQSVGERSLSDFLFITEAFGCTLGVEVDEIISYEPLKIKIKKSGKKLTEYHMLEAAYIGYVIDSNGKEISEIIFESPYYSVSVNWKPYVTNLLFLFSYFCDSSDFKVNKTHLCRICRYSDRCFQEMVNLETLSFLHGISERSVQKLYDLGISNLYNLLDSEDLLKKELGVDRALKILFHVRSIVEKRAILFKPIYKLPEGLYLDIESHTPFDFDYLFGVLEKGRYIPFLSADISKEKYIFQNVIKFLDKRKVPIYHFHNYEVTRFKKLSKRYNIEIPKDLLTRFVDVYKIFLNHVAVPLPSYSLKALARFFGFQWRTNLNGMVVVDYYKEYLLTRDKNILREILKYNEDDVRATEFIVKKLNELIEESKKN
ncbi:MAG: TM0106 family RecB-like putative nuclease [Fervidobacterium sp.]